MKLRLKKDKTDPSNADKGALPKASSFMNNGPLYGPMESYFIRAEHPFLNSHFFVFLIRGTFACLNVKNQKEKNRKKCYKKRRMWGVWPDGLPENLRKAKLQGRSGGWAYKPARLKGPLAVECAFDVSQVVLVP